MASPNDNTFNLPRRPGLDDFNGASKEDDAEDPPDPTTMPNAYEQNTVEKTLVGMGKTVHVLKLYVTFTAGAPSVSAFTACNDEIELADFAPTDNGAGDTTITWPAGMMPAVLVPPMAGIVGDTAGCICADNVSNGVRVKTTTHAGVATDFNFVVYLD